MGFIEKRTNMARDTTHAVANQTNYLAKSNGDFTDAPDLPGASTTGEWDFLTGVEVSDESRTNAVAVLSDSLGDRIGSTPGTNRRWPDFLARRLQARRDLSQTAVLNEAITGNRLLHSGPSGLEFFGPAALARIDRDALNPIRYKVPPCVFRLRRYWRGRRCRACLGRGQCGRLNCRILTSDWPSS